MDLGNGSDLGSLPLRRATLNALVRAGVTRVDQVTAMSERELLAVRGLGVGMLADLKMALAAGPVRPPVTPLPSWQQRLIGDQTPLARLPLRRGTVSRLARHGITTIAEIADRPLNELLRLRHVGEQVVEDLHRVLPYHLHDQALRRSILAAAEASAAEPLGA